VSVAAVPNPQQTLAAATVRDISGKVVGQVQNVDIAPSGQAQAVQVVLNTPATPGKKVVLPARQLSYDRGAKTVVAQLTRSEIEALPSTQEKGSPAGPTAHGRY